MMSLIERAPDSWQLFEPMGYPASIEFYYDVDYREMIKLPMGAHFGVVYSPNVYVHEHSPLRPWSYVVFEVSLYQYRPERGLERSYKQVKRRQLTRFEVPHFEELWTGIIMSGKRKAG
jgi:hypothetical protein